MENTVENGSDTSVVPLSTDKDIRLGYLSHRDSVRYGMIIEKLDMLATWIGYKHNQDPTVSMDTPAHHTIGVVTALVDQIEALPSSDHDIFYHGYTSWVGKSSAEVIIEVQQKFSENDIRPLLTAKFIMVTLGPDGKAAPNVRLAISTPDEISRFKEAEQRNRLPIPEYAFMDHAIYNTSMICFPFQRNLHRQIFGGYLMRKAYEAAFTNASLFSYIFLWILKVYLYRKGVPKFVFGGEMTFHKAVDIGAVVYMNSQICYTKNNYMQVFVQGRSLNKKTNELQTVNTFRYTFKVDNPISSIIPISYADSLRYLAAKRHFDIYIAKEIPEDLEIELKNN